MFSQGRSQTIDLPVATEIQGVLVLPQNHYQLH